MVHDDSWIVLRSGDLANVERQFGARHVERTRIPCWREWKPARDGLEKVAMHETVSPSVALEIDLDPFA